MSYLLDVRWADIEQRVARQLRYVQDAAVDGSAELFQTIDDIVAARNSNADDIARQLFDLAPGEAVTSEHRMRVAAVRDAVSALKAAHDAFLGEAVTPDATRQRKVRLMIRRK